MSAYSLAHGDVVEVLRAFNDNSFDALCCDPPYGFSFMNKAWDYDVPSVALWAECLRVLKPGASLVAFGGSRTYHRLACAVEDAGFELRDQLMFLYGKGFPKSQNIALAIDKSAGAVREVAQLWAGHGTALKPAHEPIVLARKPIDGTMAQNVARWGVGGLAIDACRIGEAGGTTKGPDSLGAMSKANGKTFGNGHDGGVPVALDAGRWPANLILDEEAGSLLDAQAGPRPSTPYPEHTADGAVLPLTKRTAGGYSDAGGPSRFFYSAKVSTKEREAGCEGLALRSASQVTERKDGSDGLDSPRAGAGRTAGARNHHPTLKPISLTTWLARLIMPPSSVGTTVILVPFAGAGSEMIGCIKAGWPAVFGIERDAEYIEIARARLAHWCKESEAA